MFLSVILFPPSHQHKSQNGKSNRSLKRSDMSKLIFKNLGNDTSKNRHCTVAN